MAASSEKTEDVHLINDSQNHGNCAVTWESQQSANRLFEASWFSPSLTSTQIVSFDVIDTDDDAQDDILLTYENQNLLEDISQKEIPSPADLSLLHTPIDHSMVSETPPLEGNLPGWDTINPSNYLLNSTKFSKKNQHHTIKAPIKRQSRSKQNKKSSNTKKVKLEGYSCKLNGTIYHVVSRNLDVLEAIEKGLKNIQQTIRQHYMCNVRHLSLQLNQIETVLAILDDEQLGLEMSLEAWNEMMLHTKNNFRVTQHELDVCRRRRFEIYSSTDELTNSFSQSLSISSLNQYFQQHTSSETSNKEKNLEEMTAKSINFGSNTIGTNNQVSTGGCVHDIEGYRSCQVPKNPSYSEGVLLQTSSSRRVEKNSPPVKRKTNSKKKSSSEAHQSITLYAMHHSTSKIEKSLQLITVMDNIQLPCNLSSLVPAPDMIPTSDTNAHCSGKTLIIEDDHSIKRTSENLETLPDVTHSIACVSESIPISNDILGDDQPSNDIPDFFDVSSDNDSLPLLDKEVVSSFDGAMYGQVDLFADAESRNLSQSAFLGSKNRTPTIAKIGFHLRPYVLNGILCSGKNNMKLAINSRIYIGSLAADGTIEMNGFNFSTIGNWIKSVEGKPFSKLSKLVQRTLDVQYNGKSLRQVLEVDELFKISGLGKVKENLLIDNITKISTLQSPAAQNNPVHQNVSFSPLLKNNLTPYLAGTVGNFVRSSAITLNTKEELQLVPEEMTRAIKNIFLHVQQEYFPICTCAEQFWCGNQPFPKHVLDEIDYWE